MFPNRDRARTVTDDHGLGEVLDFMRVIWGLDHAMQRTSKRMEKNIGVTGLQRLVLRVVGRFPSISAGRLAELLHVHPSTLTGVLGRLERQGTLRRRPDPRDKRRALLGLTEEGRRLDVKTEGTIESAIQRVMGRIDPASLAAASAVLRAITSELEMTNSAAPERSQKRARRDETV